MWRRLAQLQCDALIDGFIEYAERSLRADVVGSEHLVHDLVVVAETAVGLLMLAVILVRDTCQSNSDRAVNQTAVGLLMLTVILVRDTCQSNSDRAVNQLGQACQSISVILVN